MERSWDEIPAQGNQLTGNTKTAEFQQSSHPTANNHHRQSSRHPPSRGPNRKSIAELGISPRDTTGQGPPARQASSTIHAKPRNSNDFRRISPPDTTRMRQALDLNLKPAGDIRFSPTTIPNTDQTPTPPSTRNPGTKPITHIPGPTNSQAKHTTRTKPEIGH